MAETGKLHFDLVSPEKLLFSAEAGMVVVPGVDGDFGVLAGHAPVISTLRTGIVDVTGAADGDMKIFVRGGFAEVTAKGLTILAEEAAPLASLSASDLDQKIKNLEEDVADAKDEHVRHRAETALDQLRQVRALVN
jgi:F-type H+-transporting ATPase subunit epsilon